MRPGSPEGRSLEETRSTLASALGSSVKRQSSPSSSPRGSKASRTTLDPVAQDKNRNSLPSGRETDSDWADQVEEESKEEGSKSDKLYRFRKAKMSEVREELRHRLAQKATGPPPVCRVRTLYTFEARDGAELSFQPGSIMTIHRLSESSPLRIVGTLDGKKGYVPAAFVEILD